MTVNVAAVAAIIEDFQPRDGIVDVDVATPVREVESRA